MGYVFNQELMQEMQAIASNKDITVGLLMEQAMQWYLDLQRTQLLEKQLPNGNFRVVTVHSYGICIEHITKRINIDTFKDVSLLLEDGFYPILPKGVTDT